MRKTAVLIGAMTALVCGCAASTGVIDAGNGSFYASKQAATGFSGIGTLKGEVIAEAGAFCSQRGRGLLIINTTEAKPPFIFGNFPRVEIEFKCNTAENQG